MLTAAQQASYNWPLALGLFAGTAAAGVAFVALARHLGDQRWQRAHVWVLAVILIAFVLFDIFAVALLVIHLVDPTFVPPTGGGS
jgi:hypothetical protein